MSLNGCYLKSGPVCMSYGTCTPKSYNSVSSGIPRLLSKNVSTCTRSSLAPCQIKISCSYKGVEYIPFLIVGVQLWGFLLGVWFCVFFKVHSFAVSFFDNQGVLSLYLSILGLLLLLSNWRMWLFLNMIYRFVEYC